MARSWELEPGTAERAAAEMGEASAIGMEWYAYRRLTVDQRRAYFPESSSPLGEPPGSVSPQPPKTPEPSPHSDFPLPRNMSDAWGIVLWGMLALALAFVAAESLLEVFHNPIVRGLVALVALVALATMTVYRRALLARFKDPSAGLLFGGFLLLLMVLVFSPYVEQWRWPFSVLTAPMLSVSKTDYDVLGKKVADLQTQVNDTQRALDAANTALAADRVERDELKRKLEVAKGRPAPPPNPTAGPITWPPRFFTYNDTLPSGEYAISGIAFPGTVTSAIPVHMGDAYIASEITGQREPFLIEASPTLGLPKSLTPLSTINDIPNDARVPLVAWFSSPIPVSQFIAQWSSFRVHIEYNGIKYERVFYRDDVDDYLKNSLGIGPHVTKKTATPANATSVGARASAQQNGVAIGVGACAGPNSVSIGAGAGPRAACK